MNRVTGAMLGCFALFACGVGCGGASAGAAKGPSTQPATMTETPSTGAGGAGTSGVAAPMPSEKTPGSDGMVDDVAHAQIQFEESNKAFSAASGDCASMCKALSSMQRAADHLCGLTKDDGDSGKKRCDDAQAKVDGAKERVKATCGGCG
jgi:hypothetical protein